MDYSQEYFTIENLSVNTNTLTIVKENIPYFADGTSNGVAYNEGDPTGSADVAPDITIYYSFDKITWNLLGTTSTTALTVDFTDKIYLKATCDKWASQLDSTTIWISSDVIKCSLAHCFSGNIMSLIHGDDFVNNNTLSGIITLGGIFYNDVTLTNVDNLILSGDKLSNGCYMMMFYGCSGLTSIKQSLLSHIGDINNNAFRLMFVHCTGLTTVSKNLLPFKTLYKYCYRDMFHKCTSLITAPDLPATTLNDACYYFMFYKCTSLTTAPDLPATILTNRCYYSMFDGCTSLVHPPKMFPMTVDTYSCTFMFNECTSLLEPPVLPALSVGDYSYFCMFQNCENLQYFPNLPATTLGDWCYAWMFYGCTSASNTITLPAMTLTFQCYRQMFCKCSSLQIAPELPATTLAEYCYASMFYNDTALIQAPKLNASFIPRGAYTYMFGGCMNLNYIECKAIEISDELTIGGTYDKDFGVGDTPTDNWLRTVMSVGTFVQHIDMNDWTRGVSGIPTGWNVLFVDEHGTIFNGNVKEQPEYENANPKDYKGFTVEQETSSATFRRFTNNDYIDFNGYDYVDLGLPSGTLWATCNVGASSPEEYGDYYAWGEIEPKETYSWDTYKFGSTSPFSKYDTDNKLVLDLEDDAANVVMGGSWHIPTRDQIEELYMLIDGAPTINYNGTGVAGIIATAPNHKSIFLPLAGVNLGNAAGGQGYTLNIWSSSRSSDYSSRAWYLTRSGVWYDARWIGLSVRGVIDAYPTPIPVV